MGWILREELGIFDIVCGQLKLDTIVFDIALHVLGWCQLALRFVKESGFLNLNFIKGDWKVTTRLVPSSFKVVFLFFNKWQFEVSKADACTALLSILSGSSFINYFGS